MLVIRGTKKFLDRAGSAAPVHGMSTEVLGDWYANALLWRPQVALFVNERTLLPVFVPLAPARSVVDRLSAEFENVARRLDAQGIGLDSELAAMQEWVLAKTASRSVLGTMHGFVQMAEHRRRFENEVDLVEWSVWLAATPCRLTSQEVVWPAKALRALLA